MTSWGKSCKAKVNSATVSIKKHTSTKIQWGKIKSFVLGKLSPNTTEKSPIRRLAMQRECSPSSVRLVLLTFFSIICLLIWAGFAKIDKLVSGTGQVVPSSRIQSIQNLEGGILSEILVKEGQIVEQGDIVIRINNEYAGSRYRESLARNLSLQASIARLEALINETDPVYPPAVKANKALMLRHDDILKAMQEEVRQQVDVLILESEARLYEAKEQEERKTQITTALELLEKQRKIAESAMKDNAYSPMDYITLEQKVQATQSEIALLEHSIPRLHTQAQSAVKKQGLHKAELHTKYSQEIADYQAELTALTELLEAGSDAVARTEMRSPVRGIVKGIHNHTVGGVVEPGATLMEIVPLGDTLIIETKLNPTDIAFVYPGQAAIVRLTAYDFSIYGGLEAVVEHVGADTVENNQGEIFYKMKVRTKSSTLEYQGEQLPIIIGMQADVSILTGKQSILDYLLKPLLKARQRALREQ